MAGNASAERTYTGKQLSQLLDWVDKAIKGLEVQNIGGEDGRPGRLPEKLSDRMTLRQRVREELPGRHRRSRTKRPKRINLTADYSI